MSTIYRTSLLTTTQKEGEWKLFCSVQICAFRLSLGMSGFEQQASGAVLDLMQDEEDDMKKLKGLKKW